MPYNFFVSGGLRCFKPLISREPVSPRDWDLIHAARKRKYTPFKTATWYWWVPLKSRWVACIRMKFWTPLLCPDAIADFPIVSAPKPVPPDGPVAVFTVCINLARWRCLLTPPLSNPMTCTRNLYRLSKRCLTIWKYPSG